MADRREENTSNGQAILALSLIALSVLLLMALVSYEWGDVRFYRDPPNRPPHNLIGLAGAWGAFQLFWSLGLAAYAVPVLVFTYGLLLLLKSVRYAATKLGWLTFFLAGLLILFEMLGPALSGARARLNLFSPGGTVGHVLGPLGVLRLLGEVGGAILLAFIFIVSAFFLFDLQPTRLLADVRRWVDQAWQSLRARWSPREREAQQELLDEFEIARRRRAAERRARREAEEPASPPAATDPEPTPLSLLRDSRRERTRAAPPPPAPEPEPVAEEEDDDEPALEITLPEPPAPVPEPPPAPPPVSSWNDPAPAARPGARKAAAEAAMALPELSPSGPLAAEGEKPWVLPPMTMLHPVPDRQTASGEGLGDEAAILLEATLKEFGIDAKVTNIEVGPTVTSFEVLPAPGVRVEKIANLSKNIALKLKAESIRVQAPIPGKGVVGIEVPNPKGAKVVIRQILEAPEWKASKAALPLVVGIDVSGRKIVADLADMPHLLIAGSTGSGKSVCMNSLLAGLLMSRSPDQLRMILVDPKIVEFKPYNELPHLVVPVITDPKKVALGLRWAINEMEKRYKLFAKIGVRNIKSYNSRPPARQQDLFSLPEEEGQPPPEQPPAQLPYIVIVIDELADLMLQVKAEVENSIARLAQLSRAVGIHMIIATQRPTVNVITGTIKANFPCRIAFKVAQSNDSRTILDANGADALLGKGDMLFLPPGVARLLRAQGALTTDEEITKLVEFLKAQGEPAYESSIKDKLDAKAASAPEKSGGGGAGGGGGAPFEFNPEEDGDDDEALITAATQIIKETRRASTSSLQRRLRIGYNRAARLMDQLQERGVVGPPQGSDPREILIDLEGEIPDNDAGGPVDEADSDEGGR
jgi:S-DNA-T family DNA segregation ATPase FtsK/SpoIIIE